MLRRGRRDLPSCLKNLFSQCWLLPYDCWDSTLSTTRRYSICFIIRLIITVSFSFFLCNLVPNLNNVRINALMKLYSIQTRWRFKKYFTFVSLFFLCIFMSPQPDWRWSVIFVSLSLSSFLLFFSSYFLLSITALSYAFSL